MTKRIIILLMVIFAYSAYAEDYGRWLCTECGDASTLPMGEAEAFSRSQVVTNRWKPGDTITVCNASVCLPIG